MQKLKFNKAVLAAASLVVVSGAIAVPMLAKPVTQVNFQDMDDESWVKCLKARIETKIFKAIDATEEQKTSLSKLVDETIETNKPLRAQMKEKVSALTKGMADDNVSDDQLRTMLKDTRSLRDKIAENREENLLKMRAILTSEQRKILASRFESIRKRFQPGRFLNQDAGTP